jgi:hypothetical protein
MKVFLKPLMLGLNFRKNMLYPRKEHITRAILEAFNVEVDNIINCSIFGGVWRKNQKCMVGASTVQ